MIALSSGQRIAINQLIPTATAFQLAIGIQTIANTPLTCDAACFGVDANDKLSDDRYFIFYNQPRSPEGAIVLNPPKDQELQRFHVDLKSIPAHIKKIVCTVSIDGSGVMSAIEDGYLRLLDGENEIARFTFSGQQFNQERAIIIAEIYWKESWKMLALGQGFSGGLSALLKHYGGEEIEPSSPSSPPLSTTKTQKPPVNLTKAVQLEKQVQEKAPHLVSLVKKVNVILEKKQIHDIVAKVVMVMDASGSMGKSYRTGLVQAVVDRISVVAMRMDDDGALETWFYGSDYKQTPDITIDNLAGYIQQYGKPGGANNEPPVMETITRRHHGSLLPVLVIFVTDGGITKKKEIVQILQKASHSPIFWQFMGMAGSHYGILEELDTCSGRFVDNANFFAIDDLESISDDQLFERILGEFPSWLKEIKQKGLL